MKLKQAKEEVMQLIQTDIDIFGLNVGLSAESPDTDQGKFWLDDREARVILPRDGFYAKINTKWFVGSNDPPKIGGGVFYWYVFALDFSEASKIRSYFICDYHQLRNWVLEFDKKSGGKHRKNQRWRGEIIGLESSKKFGYFRWGDESATERINNRFVTLRNVDELINSTYKGVGKNPHWTRDELILALDLYFKINISSIASSEHDARVQELSLLLKKLPIHRIAETNSSFRSPASVYMKLMNFLSFDPEYSGKGLDASSKLDFEIWKEFSTHKVFLEHTANAIKTNFTSFTPDNLETGDDEEFLEGRILAKVHKSRERNPKVVQAKKRDVLKKTRKLACEVCGFDFFEFYGDLGREFAECHHKVPLSELKPNSPTSISDLEIVCANCHRMIHRTKPFTAAYLIRELLEKKKAA